MKLIDILVQELPKRDWLPISTLAITQDEDGSVCLWGKEGAFSVDGSWKHPSGTGLLRYLCNENAMEPAEDRANAIVTRDQYEAALAAIKPEWNGEAPPAIIGRFVPIGNFNCGAMPFNVLTRVASGYMPPAWEGIREGGERYHVIEKAWRFEPVEWDGEGLPKAGVECEWQDKNTKAWIPVVIAYSSEWVTVVRELTPSKNGDAVECCINNFGEEERLQFRPICSEADKKRDESLCAMRNCVSNFNNTSVIHAIGQVYDAISAGKIPGIRVE